MTRQQIDIVAVVVLVVGGLFAFPWARVQYHLLLLRSPNAEQALQSQAALEQLGADVLPAVERFVRRTNAGTARRMGIEVLLRQESGRAGYTDRPDVVRLAVDVAERDWDQEAQSRAIQWLSLGAVPEAQLVFRRLLAHPDPIIRADAARALAGFGDPADAAYLARLLHDPDPLVVQLVSIAVGRLTGDRLTFPRGDTEVETREREELIAEWLARRHFDTPAAPLPRPSASTLGPPARGFVLPDLDEQPVRLADFRGKPVLLNFWATWCPPCEQELPALAAIAEEFRDRVVVVGVTQEFESSAPAERALRKEGALQAELHEDGGHHHGMDHLDAETAALVTRKQHEMIEETVAQKGLDYPVVIGNATVGEAFGVHVLPVTVLVGADGRIRRRIVGPRHASYFRALLAEATG